MTESISYLITKDAETARTTREASYVLSGTTADGATVEYLGYAANGYTYYYFEGFFMTETDIGDSDIVYVQISDNAYIEVYNVMFEESLEDFVNGSFYIEEVTVK